MILESIRLGGRLRNRRRDDVRENGRIVVGEVWQENLYIREESEKILRMARNCFILHMLMERMNES
jgi:hypothetical protein